MSTILVLISPDFTPALNNDYGLTTEDELNYPAKQTAIQRFWKGTREGAFKGCGDITIRYRYTDSQGDKGGIVIVNGRRESFLKYKETAYDLYRQGFSIYMYDHRGQGVSGRMLHDPCIGHVEDFNHYVRDLKKFYQQVVNEKEKNDVYLLAHSMGGAIAALYLEEYPGDFRAAALASPMMEINTGIVPTAVACKTADWLQGIRQLMEWRSDYIPFTGPYKKKSFSENRLSHSQIRYKIFTSLYEKRPEAALGGPSPGWVSAACKAGRKARQEADRIKTPVLLLQAGQDELVTASGQQEFCDHLVSGGTSRCHGGGPKVIKGAYHELLIEKDEYRIPALTQVLDFFAKQ